MICDIVERYPDLEGLYHVASAPISKFDLLSKIRDGFDLDIEIEPTDGVDCNRSLDSRRFVSATGVTVPDWDELIADLVSDETPYDEWRASHATA